MLVAQMVSVHVMAMRCAHHAVGGERLKDRELGLGTLRP
jgi:hypothetical protein